MALLIEQLDLEQLNTVTLESGDVVATLNIGSNMLPHVTVDTYGTFDGSSFFAMETENWVDEHGFNDDEVDVRLTDSDAILRGLGEVMLAEMSNQLEPWVPNPDDRVIVTPGELTSVYSPRYYNFQTDSFAADYAVNLTALSEWLTDFGFDGEALEAWGRRQWASRDGFFSFIPSRLDSSDERTETLAWLATYLYLEQTLDAEALMYAGAEREGDLYMNNTEASCNHSVYTDRLDKRVAELTATHADLIDGLIVEWATAAGVDYFGETPDPWDLLERVEADAQKIVAANPQLFTLATEGEAQA